MIINKFALFLVIGALFTSFFWIIYKWKFKKQHQEMLAREEAPKSVHVWFDGIGGLFPVILFVLIFRSFIFEPFQIPSGSMIRTLLVGDFLLVNKFSLGVKNPVTNENWIKIGSPERGDVVVFKAPVNDNIDYIKRVIGMPNEVVRYNYETKELQVFSNCQANIGNISIEACKPVDVSYSELKPSEIVGVRFTMNNFVNIPVSQNPVYEFAINLLVGNRLIERTETIAGHSHVIINELDKIDSIKDYYKGSKKLNEFTYEFVIPEGQYLMMGDNRDHSQDSRFFGFVSEEALVGKASFIWISFERQPNEWPTGIRFNRIGTIE